MTMVSPPVWIIKTCASTGRNTAMAVWWSPDNEGGLFARNVYPPPRPRKRHRQTALTDPKRLEGKKDMEHLEQRQRSTQTDGLTATKVIAYLSDWERRGAISMNELGSAIEEIGRVMQTAEYAQAVKEYREQHGKSRWGAP